MILCPNCQHREISGALFCGECGANLIPLPDVPVSTILSAAAHQTGGTAIPPAPPCPSPMDNCVALYLMESEKLVQLAEREEFTLGRVNEGQPIIPDVDLGPYGGYENGVSRLHATISLGEQVTLTDLGSVNGTRLNGKKIPANIPHPLTHGDVMTLGRMKVQILINSPQSS